MSYVQNIEINNIFVSLYSNLLDNEQHRPQTEFLL